MSTALLVDTGFSSLPLIMALESKNIHVHVVGLKGSDGLAERVAKYHKVDYSDPSALERVVLNVRPDYLIPGCTDVSYLSCALIAEKFGFAGFDRSESVSGIHDKSQLRHNVIAAGLSAPNVVPPPYDSLDFPVIIKPVDSYSGNGITVLRSKSKKCFERAKGSAQRFSASGSFIVEKFVTGQLVSHSAFIFRGEIKRDFWVNEYCSASPFSVDTSYVTRDEHKDIHSSFRKGIQRLAQRLGLVDGLLHTQFIRSTDKCFVIESTRRCPGDLYSKLITLTTGFDYSAAYLAPYTQGEVSPDWSASSDSRNILRHTVSSGKAYSYFGVEFCEPVSLVNWIPTARTGDVLPGGSSGRSAIFFAETRCPEELEHLVSQSIARKLYKLSGARSGMDAGDSDNKMFSRIRGAFPLAVSLSERSRAESAAVSQSGLAGIQRHIGVKR